MIPARRLRPGIQPKLQALQVLYEGKKIIVGRDKLDVVKGVLQKVSFLILLVQLRNSCLTYTQLRAFEKLLIDYPQWRGNVRALFK
jgi:trehalose 6-phosphate synthase/phosphatase